jgi:hypothetical protein
MNENILLTGTNEEVGQHIEECSDELIEIAEETLHPSILREDLEMLELQHCQIHAGPMSMERYIRVKFDLETIVPDGPGNGYTDCIVELYGDLSVSTLGVEASSEIVSYVPIE